MQGGGPLQVLPDCTAQSYMAWHRFRVCQTRFLPPAPCRTEQRVTLQCMCSDACVSCDISLTPKCECASLAGQDAFDGRPFAQLLAEQGLQPGVRALLLYAVALLEADQVGAVNLGSE